MPALSVNPCVHRPACCVTFPPPSITCVVALPLPCWVPPPFSRRTPPSRALTDQCFCLYASGECSIVRNSYQICLCFYASLQMIKFLLYIVLSISKGHVSYHNLNPTIIPHWPPLMYIVYQTIYIYCQSYVI